MRDDFEADFADLRRLLDGRLLESLKAEQRSRWTLRNERPCGR